jgi:hypothetical protein
MIQSAIAKPRRASDEALKRNGGSVTAVAGPPGKHLHSHPGLASGLSADPDASGASIECGSRPTNAEQARNAGSRRFKFTLLYHPVVQLSDSSKNRSKSPRVRAICDCAWTLENVRHPVQPGTGNRAAKAPQA